MTKPDIDLDSLFNEAWGDSEFRFAIKTQTVATDLARAVADAGQTRAAVADKLGWKPSRLSKILSGDANLTLRTLHELSEALGLEFDVILRHRDQARAAQPWEAEHCQQDIRTLHREAQDRLQRSTLLLDTAARINRNAWQRGQAIARRSTSTQRVLRAATA